MTASPAEIIWTLVSALGVFLRGRNLREAWRDMNAAAQAGNEAMRLLARSNLAGEVIGLVAKVGFTVIGLWAMTIPANPAPGTGLYQAFAAAVFILIVVALDVNSELTYRTRKRIAKELEEAP